MHIHQHLAIFDHGKAVRIPEDVGRPLGGNCFYWLHTRIRPMESSTSNRRRCAPIRWGVLRGLGPTADALRRRRCETTAGRAHDDLGQRNALAGDPRSHRLDAAPRRRADAARRPVPYTAWNGFCSSGSPGARTTGLSSCEFLVLRSPAPIAQPSVASKAIGFRGQLDFSVPVRIRRDCLASRTTIACRDSMMPRRQQRAIGSRYLKLRLSTRTFRYARRSTDFTVFHRRRFKRRPDTPR